MALGYADASLPTDFNDMYEEILHMEEEDLVKALA
jgi:hypothetical protein